MAEPTDEDGDVRKPSIQPASTVYERADDERPSEAVVRAVATATDTAVLDLDPLYDVLDPEQLDGIVESGNDDCFHEGSSITFSFNGCRVTMTEDTVRVETKRD